MNFILKFRPIFSIDTQGPALLVKNDGKFTVDDLKGISNLGTGSKREDSLKAGQYGVGFNCVYHLTDTPTFLANIEGEGRMLCAMDPRLTNVPEATLQSPGRQFPWEKYRSVLHKNPSSGKRPIEPLGKMDSTRK